MSQPTMNPPGNPATAERGNRGRYGDTIGGGWRTVHASGLIQASMSPPTSERECVRLGVHRYAEVLVWIPSEVAGCTIHVGRWLHGPTWNGGGAGLELDVWAEDRAAARSTSTDESGAFVLLGLETWGEPIGVYVDSVVGTPTDLSSFGFWMRGGAGPGRS